MRGVGGGLESSGRQGTPRLGSPVSATPPAHFRPRVVVERAPHEDEADRDPRRNPERTRHGDVERGVAVPHFRAQNLAGDGSSRSVLSIASRARETPLARARLPLTPPPRSRPPRYPGASLDEGSGHNARHQDRTLRLQVPREELLDDVAGDALTGTPEIGAGEVGAAESQAETHVAACRSAPASEHDGGG
jgi:hypothetical protein